MKSKKLTGKKATNFISDVGRCVDLVGAFMANVGVEPEVGISALELLAASMRLEQAKLRAFAMAEGKSK